jgi:2'-5' RNA ligase
MRVFIGIKPDTKSLQAICQLISPLASSPSPIRWVKSENIHLTLKFLGDITDQQFKEIEKILTTPDLYAAINPFSLNLRGVGKFGKGNQISIFWVGITVSSELQTLFQLIEDNLTARGFCKELRPFSPHLTLGRNKTVFDTKSIHAFIETHKQTKISEFSVTGFTIFKSSLASTGPIYSVLKEVQFA